MNNRNKMLYIFLSVMLLCALVCSLYFFETGLTKAQGSLPPLTVMLAEGTSTLIFTDENGAVTREISIAGLDLSADEIKTLQRGISVSSDAELMSIAEDYSS